MALKNDPHSFSTIILAAGISKRMYSRTPKILYRILGKPMIQYVVDIAFGLNCEEVIVVTGKNKNEVKKVLGNRVKYAVQEIPLGTGDATKKGIVFATKPNILILYGDVPLLRNGTISAMIRNHFNKNGDLSVLTCKIDNPAGYGRIVRDKNGKFIKIVEHLDANEKELKINEINTGIYFGSRKLINDALFSLKTYNKQNEFYLTDIVHYLIKKRKKVLGFQIDNQDEILGINNKADLARVREIIKRKWFEELMLRGVYIEEPATTNIDLTVKIGNFVQIRPFTIIEGKTEIKDNTIIGPFVWIKDGIKRKIKI